MVSKRLDEARAIIDSLGRASSYDGVNLALRRAMGIGKTEAANILREFEEKCIIWISGNKSFGKATLYISTPAEILKCKAKKHNKFNSLARARSEFNAEKANDIKEIKE